MKEQEIMQAAETARLQKMLDDECKKTPRKRDYDKIAALTDAIYKLNSDNDLSEIAERGIAEIAAISTQESAKHKQRRIRSVVTAAACAVMLLGCNLWSVNAFGMNLVQKFYEITHGGITFQPSSSPAILQEMHCACERCGITPPLPQYLPDGMTLTHVDADSSGFAGFYLENGSESVEFSFSLLPEGYSLPDMETGFPSEHYGIYQCEIGDTKIYCSKEDQQFTAMFIHEKLICTMFTERLSYTESEKILYSFFETPNADS